ncbi:MAG TPA: thioredoxin-disulfide reductase [Thermodesulfobacteriota bacterium]|nr:thioredoxin-disulfide reductase [Thermodesulfobacteriota bacterium]
MDSVCHDLVILGGGPAGLTAGLYAARSRLDAVLLEGKACGGQLMTYEWVENYPGFPEGIGAPELVQRMVDQAARFGLKIEKEQALGVEIQYANPEKIVILKEKVIRCKALIIATGAHERKINVEGEERLTGRGVSYCATCDGAFFEDCVISVVGGGDMAVEEAMYLTRFGKQVNLIHRRNELRATKVIQERAFKNPKMKFVWDTIVTRINGDELVTGVTLKNLKTGAISELSTDGVFIFIGTLPSTDFLRRAVALDEEGFVLTNKEMETDAPGVFAAGDVVSKRLRQISASVGEGSIAAFNAERYLDTL